MNKTQINLSLEDDAIELLDEMAGKALNRQAVARMLLIAAIEAVQANGGKIHLPPKFTVHDDSPFTGTRFNEPTTKTKK
jgi:hypothetical protein